LVRLTYQRVFAPLRNHIFYSIRELNEAIAELNKKHLNTPFQRLNTTRMELFLEVEKDELKPLPPARYEFKKFLFPTVAFNYHIYLSEDMRQGGYTTKKDHMHPSHRYYSQWNPKRIIGWAAKIGPDVKTVVAKILGSREYPEQAYRTCVGIISMAKKYGNIRLNNACKRALSYGLYKYKAIKNILDKGLDSVEQEKVYEQKLPLHKNIRGADYYKLT